MLLYARFGHHGEARAEFDAHFMSELPSNSRRELVSCIMPTRDRPDFLAQALRCFLHQTHARSELHVIDDGEYAVENMCADLPRVHYLRLDRPTPTGTKMNLAIGQAQGSIIQKLDDDDYYHPDFVERAVSNLPADEDERLRTIVAWDCFLVLVAGTNRPRFSGHGWNAGGTLCFAKNLWERRPFRDVRAGSDSWFLRDHDPQIIRVCAPEHYIVVRHGRNTWVRMHDGERADVFLASLPLHSKALEALVDSHACSFYSTLRFDRSFDSIEA